MTSACSNQNMLIIPFLVAISITEGLILGRMVSEFQAPTVARVDIGTYL